ncbi:DUF4856 domain-containing protein [Mangrovimonas sp. ST2L15]|uniref:DUF4856 domain-containing protein n=1 Tax=Mangrovimonas sp. ST2L15 TaxID=1645916 RepID=UPI0006B62B0F|nr:DUF4856 domain-containing protein [Mangrovimonas sp. ST2L15]
MKQILFRAAIITGLITSCSSDDDQFVIEDNQLQTPTTYEFTRNGESTVYFGGQTTRIAMATELKSALVDPSKTEADLDGMFAHVEGESNFSDADLNASGKNIRSKVAASYDYFSTNTTLSNTIKADFDTWIADQATNVFPNWLTTATAGNAGNLQQAGGGSTRYVNAQGLEINQVVAKGLIGGLMLDQIANNYLSTAILDEASNVADNNNGVVEEGENFTTMEHKWDEAYGYLYGAEANPASPVLEADSFLNEYLAVVNSDADFAGIAQTVFDAFALGRAALVAKDYDLRDTQADIIRTQLSKVLAVRAVHYLQGGKGAIADGDMALAFHELSEGFGFLYSLQFTRDPNTDAPYFSHEEVMAYVTELTSGNGFWEVSSETLDTISAEVAARFNFSVEAAAN